MRYIKDLEQRYKSGKLTPSEKIVMDWIMGKNRMPPDLKKKAKSYADKDAYIKFLVQYVKDHE